MERTCAGHYLWLPQRPGTLALVHEAWGEGCDRLTYLCKLTQCVLQHLHSEDEGALCQHLAVSISQIFPAVIRRQKWWGSVRGHTVQPSEESAPYFHPKPRDYVPT